MYISLLSATNILKGGGIVAFPTETVYGLGAIATNTYAVAKIFKAKNRPHDNPLICHFYNLEQIEQYVMEISYGVRILFNNFSPGPLSVLLSLPPNSPLFPATCGSKAVVCRIPDHPLALELIKRVGVPLAAPSANTSGRMSGTTAKMVEQDLGTKIDGVVDGGPCRVGIESTIIDGRSESNITILRPGIIGRNEFTQVLEKAYENKRLSWPISVEEVKKLAVSEVIPGTKYRHYTPLTSLYRINNLQEFPPQVGLYAIIATKEQLQSLGVLCLETVVKRGEIYYICLGSRSKLEEVIRKVYYSFFILDTLNVPRAFFIDEDWGDSSLAKALRDRLKKALL